MFHHRLVISGCDSNHVVLSILLDEYYSEEQ